MVVSVRLRPVLAPQTASDMKTSLFTRRNFLKQTTGLALTAAALPSLVPAAALGKAGKVAPSNRVVVGCIGVGPQGQGDMGNFLNQKDAQVVAVCDVMASHLEQARTRVNQHYKNDDCQGYGDFREVVARKDIDAFLIATPDHWHVLTALAAVRAGKDVYVEKPLGINLAEDWALRKEVHRCKRVFQFGTQQRSTRIFRLASELVRNGRIGTLKHINVWSRPARPAAQPKSCPCRRDWTTTGGWGPRPSGPIRRISARARATRRPGGTSASSRSGSLLAGAFTRWTSPPGAGAICSAARLRLRGAGHSMPKGACDTATAWNIDMKFGSGVTLRFEGTPNRPTRARRLATPGPTEMNGASAIAASPTTAPPSRARKAGCMWIAAASTSSRRALLT